MSRAKSQAPIFRSAIASYVPDALVQLMGSHRVDVVRRVGADAVKDVIADVLCGRNLRDSTEMLTRRRIGLVNAATMVFFVKGIATARGFVGDLPAIAADGLAEAKSKPERSLLQWVLGLTEKAVQNVLRDSSDALRRHHARFVEAMEEIAKRCEEDHGPVAGEVSLADGSRAPISWRMLLALFCTIGSQTLAIRGSEKSTYGKLFERLILGTVLQVLGFKRVAYPPTENRMVFWLSSRLGTRECDATALIKPGQAVRFDIGFIGRGNPEISKDEVSRYERELEIARQKYYAATFIVVDRIGDRSTIVQHAKAINGTIVQMSMSFWPQQLARELSAKVDFRHEICGMPSSRLEEYLRKAAGAVSLEGLVDSV